MTVVFFSIGLKDPEAATPFFRDVFGWELGPGKPPISAATVNPGGPGDFDVTGNLTTITDGRPPSVSLFVRVPDLDAALETAQSTYGSHVLVPRFLRAPGDAELAIIRGPEDLVFGVVQA